MPARLTALAIALAAGAGIGLELAALLRGGASLASAAWALVLYFTILTNGLVAVMFGALALAGARSVRPQFVAGIVAAIALVGVVYALLLQDTRALAGGTALADLLLHRVTPVLAPIYWLAFAPKGRLSWGDPLRWTLYPLAYLGYALARGSIEGRYPYPFIDLAANSWLAVVGVCTVITLCFVAAGEGLVLLDRAMARGRR